MQRRFRNAFGLIAFVSCVIFVSEASAGDILSVGTLEQCVNDGALEGLRCTKKLAVQYAVPNGQLAKSEELEFNLACVNSDDGECPCACNAATDPGCECRDLAAPLKVSLAKSMLFATYAMTYIKSFNWKPVESILWPGDNKCKGDDLEPYPTCGWQYTTRGDRIPESQGFCCDCSDEQVEKATFTKEFDQRTRANLDCGSFAKWFASRNPNSAHCLTFDVQDFSGYQLGPPSLQFEILVTVKVPTAPAISNGSSSIYSDDYGATDRTEVLTLGPSQTMAVSSGGYVSAKLVGDLSQYTQLSDLSDKILMVPEPPGTTSGIFNMDDSIAANRSAWMLVDKSLITFDGSVCDKVGTSYMAFNNQQNACSREQQSCLSNQLKDLWEVDQERIRQGKVPEHLLSQFSGGKLALLNYKGGPLKFTLPVTSMSNSVIKLSIKADNLRLITVRSPGKIVGLKACRFNRSDCGGFEAGNRGFIALNISNTGGLTADYTLSVRNCSMNVRRVEARQVSVEAYQTVAVEPPVDLYVEDAKSDPNRACWVTLVDSQGDIVDSQLIKFFTNGTVFTPKPIGGFNGTGDGPGIKRNATDCEEKCKNPLNIFCIVMKRCWSRLFRFLGMALGAILSITLVALAIKLGWVSALCQCFGICFNCTPISSSPPSAGGGDGRDGDVGGWGYGSHPAAAKASDKRELGAYSAPPPQMPPSEHPCGRAYTSWWQPPFGWPAAQLPQAAAAFTQQASSHGWDPASNYGPQPSYKRSNRHGPTMQGAPSAHPWRGIGPVMSGLRAWYSRQVGGLAVPSGGEPTAAARLSSGGQHGSGSSRRKLLRGCYISRSAAVPVSYPPGTRLGSVVSCAPSSAYPSSCRFGPVISGLKSLYSSSRYGGSMRLAMPPLGGGFIWQHRATGGGNNQHQGGDGGNSSARPHGSAAKQPYSAGGTYGGGPHGSAAKHPHGPAPSPHGSMEHEHPYASYMKQ